MIIDLPYFLLVSLNPLHDRVSVKLVQEQLALLRAKDHIFVSR